MGRLGLALHADKRFADVTVLLTTPASTGGAGAMQGGPPEPLPPAESLPAGMRVRVHSVVLAALSGYFDARLTRPLSVSDPSAPLDAQGQRVLVEHMEDEQQLQAAEAVLQCMYKEHVPAHLTMKELALMCRIADQWQAASCTDMCFVALTQQHEEQLDRQAALAIVSLLPECVQALPEYVQWVQRCHSIIMGDVAAGKDARPLLLAAFGDVHAVLSTPTWLRLFLQLPYEAVLAWAASDDLVVDSENSVVAALDCWLQGYVGRNSQCKGDVTLRHLSDLVRVQHLSPVYLLRLPQVSWFKHNGTLQQFTAAVLAGSVGGMLGTWDVPRSWTLPARRQLPDSVLQQRTTLRYEAPGQELAEPTRLKHLGLSSSAAVYSAGAAFCLALGAGGDPPASALSVGFKPAEYTVSTEGKLITVVPLSVLPLQLEAYRVYLLRDGGGGGGAMMAVGAAGGEGVSEESSQLVCQGGKTSISPPLGWVAPNLFNRSMAELKPLLVDGKLRLKAMARVMRCSCAAELHRGASLWGAAGPAGLEAAAAPSALAMAAQQHSNCSR